MEHTPPAKEAAPPPAPPAPRTGATSRRSTARLENVAGASTVVFVEQDDYSTAQDDEGEDDYEADEHYSVVERAMVKWETGAVLEG